MSDKIMNMLNSGEFRRQPPLFQAACIENAISRGRIGVCSKTGFLIDLKGEPGNQILIGLLPPALSPEPRS